MTLWKFSAQEFWNRPGRAVLTLLSVVIGVATVVSVGTATRATHQSFDEMYVTVTGRAFLEVVAVGGDSISTDVVHDLEQIPGIAAAVPTIQRPTIVSRPGGKRLKLLTLGVDPKRDNLVRDYQLKEGKFMEEGGLVEAAFARAAGLAIGDRVNLVTRRGARNKVTIVGLLEQRGAAAFTQSGVLFVPLDEAQEIFDEENRCDVISLVLADGARENQVTAAVAAKLPPGLTAHSPSSRTQLAKETLVSTEQGLNTASAYSLVASLFIIMNTFLMNVGERRPQLAVLRAIGATRGQVVWMMLREGLVLGIVGTLIGIPVGLGGAYLLLRVMELLYHSALPTLFVTPPPLILGAALGLGVSLFAAWLPARNAGRISPLEGMRRISAEDSGKFPVFATLVAAVLFTASIIGLFGSVWGWVPPSAAIPIGMMALIALVGIVPAVLALLVAIAWYPLRSLLRVEGQLARLQLLRRRVRTSLTVGVLLVAIATGIGMGNTIMDNVDDVQRWYHQTVVGDFFVRATMPDVGSGKSAEMPAELQSELEAIDGVRSVEAMRFVNTEAAGQAVVVSVRDFSRDDKLPLDLVEGSEAEIRPRLAAGEVVVGTVLAHRVGVKPGDEIKVETRNGPVAMRVAGTATEYMVGGLVLFMDRSVAQKYLDVTGADAFVVKAAPESIKTVEAAIDGVCEKHSLLVQSFADISRAIDGTVNGIVGSLWAILVLVLIVAAFGMINTLTMNVLEQTRELGLLRVIAMTRWQVRKTILSQAAIMGAIGLVTGSIAGIVVAYIINMCMLPVVGHQPEFTLHPVLWYGCIPVALLIVVGAALIPAERAARLQLVEALRCE